MNPTNAALEERIAALEGGRAALATASGMSAQMVALLTLLEAGDQMVAARTLYGGTYSQFDVSFRKLGIDTVFVDPDDPENFRRAITDKTRVVYGETIGNPVGNVLDLEAIAAVAHDAGVPFMVDNTFATPYLCRPFDFGADIIVHSATKFLGGHGTTMGGLVVEKGDFDWGNGKFPGMTEPSPGYHGVIFHETFGDFGYAMKCRVETLRTYGPAMSPFNAFLLLQGVETLPLRMERHVANAQAVAEHLRDHPLVSWVQYAGLPDSPYHALARKYLPRGPSSIFSFGIKGGMAAGIRFIESLQFLSHLANVGDAKTLVIHPASTTHRQLSEEQQIAAGVGPDMIRLSIGLETLDDILWDIDQALATAAAG
jgi:O-acetylhomoserine (thiol)-lyase